MDYSRRGLKESDMTEGLTQTHTHTRTHIHIHMFLEHVDKIASNYVPAGLP